MLLVEVVDGLFATGIVVHGRFEEETQEALDAIASGTGGEVAQQRQVEQQRSGEDGVAAEEVDLNLHGITHPSEYIYIVPSLLVVIARRIVVDTHLVIILHVLVVAVSVEVGLVGGLEDGLEGRELAHLLGVEVGGLVEHQSVAVAEDVGREPATQSETARADDGRKATLDERLSGLEILAGDGHAGLLSQLPHGGYVDRGIGGTHDEGSPSASAA